MKMEPFVKLDLNCDSIWKARKGAFVTRYGPIKYYRVIGNPIPFDFLKLCEPNFIRWVEVDSPAQPHRDHNMSAAINFYFEPNGATTTFWTASPNAKAFQYPGSAKSNIYTKEGLIRGPSFTAQPGDTYLMNNSEIHSVDIEPGRLRRFIQLSWIVKPFDDILQVLPSKR